MAVIGNQYVLINRYDKRYKQVKINDEPRAGDFLLARRPPYHGWSFFIALREFLIVLVQLSCNKIGIAMIFIVIERATDHQ